MNLLFLLPYDFIPPDKGNKHLIFNLLRYVSGNARCDLIVLVDRDADRDAVNRKIRSAFPMICRLWIVTKPHWVFQVPARLRAILSGYHPAIGGYWSRAVVRKILEALAECRYDVAHFDMVYMAQYRAFTRGVPSVLVPSDAYSFSFDLCRKAARTIRMKVRTLVESHLMANIETGMYRQFEAICTVSRTDADYFRSLTGHTNIRKIGIAIGEEFIARAPRAFEASAQRSEAKVLLAGAIHVEWVAGYLVRFLDTVFPRIQVAFPNIRVTVLGRRPAKMLRGYLNPAAGVDHVEFVDDFVEFMNQDWIYVHAHETAAGFQTKVQQAMALGLPVVGRELAFSGMDVKTGKHCFVCRSDQEMGETIVALLKDPGLRRDIGLAAASCIRENYSIKRMGEQMLAIFREWAAPRKAPVKLEIPNGP